MRILGIDPGVATVGFAVLETGAGSQHLVTCGAITTPAGLRLSARLLQIEGDLHALIAQFSPDVMAVEELFFSKNVTTGIAAVRKSGRSWR